MAYSSYYRSIRLAESLCCYIWQGRGNNCNTCLFANLLRGGYPHVIVDPGHVRNEFREPCFDYLVQAMEKDGFNIEDIGLIINTHTHPDHCEATELVVQRSGASVTLSREEHEFYDIQGKKLSTMFGVQPVELNPLFYLGEGNLSLGSQNKVNLQVLLTPGHSPGEICLYWREGKVLISGDVVFFGSIGRTDLPGGSLSELKKSIDMLAQLDVEHLVPGHSTEFGSIVSGRQNVERNFQAVKLFI